MGTLPVVLSKLYERKHIALAIGQTKIKDGDNKLIDFYPYNIF